MSGAKRRSFESGHRPKFLVVVDGSPESSRAVHFAARRVARIGASLVMLAKGNRSQAVVDACRKHGGFYLGTPGGPAALLAQQFIKSQEIVEYPELGMEAVWKIRVENFPAFILMDNKGHDFLTQISQCPLTI